VGAGLIGPGTIFGILACFFKPLLRKLLLKYKFTKLADCIVPDVEGDVSNIREDMNVVKVFMARQRSRLPPLKDQTPEMSVGDVAIDDASVAPLGRGGFGVVYRGKLHQTTVVAIKTIFGQGPFHAVVPADIRKMMLREAKIMCNLNHPNVLQIFGVVPEKGWIVMELCNGGALSELLLDTGEAIDAHELLRFSAETATGVAYLHLHDIAIVHGDLKAANVLLTADRSVRIADFGLAEAKDRSKTSNSSMIAAPTGITSRWTAPEILNGEPKSFASDVFALGMTMYEIFERKRPFASMADSVVERKIVDGERPLVGATVLRLAAKLMHACWANNAKKRPSASIVAYSLTELLGDGVV
jgi:serine/threonine protein kinase